MFMCVCVHVCVGREVAQWLRSVWLSKLPLLYHHLDGTEETVEYNSHQVQICFATLHITPSAYPAANEDLALAGMDKTIGCASTHLGPGGASGAHTKVVAQAVLLQWASWDYTQKHKLLFLDSQISHRFFFWTVPILLKKILMLQTKQQHYSN